MRGPKLSRNECRPTFHISFSLENDEGVTPATTILVTNNSYTFDRPKTFEFAPEIALGRGFWLENRFVRTKVRRAVEHSEPNER